MSPHGKDTEVADGIQNDLGAAWSATGTKCDWFKKAVCPGNERKNQARKKQAGWAAKIKHDSSRCNRVRWWRTRTAITDGNKTRENEGNGRGGSEHRGKRARTGWGGGTGAEVDGGGQRVYIARRSTEGAELVPDKVGAVAGKKYSGRRARARNALRGSAKTGFIGQDGDPRSDLKPKLEYTDLPRWAASGNPSARRNIGRNRRRAGWQGDDSRTLRREHGKVSLPEWSQGRQKVGTKSADGGVNCELNDSFKEPRNEDVLAQIKKNLEAKKGRLQRAPRGQERGRQGGGEEERKMMGSPANVTQINNPTHSERACGAARNSERMAGATGNPKRKGLSRDTSRRESRMPGAVCRAKIRRRWDVEVVHVQCIESMCVPVCLLEETLEVLKERMSVWVNKCREVSDVLSPPLLSTCTVLYIHGCRHPPRVSLIPGLSVPSMLSVYFRGTECEREVDGTGWGYCNHLSDMFLSYVLVAVVDVQFLNFFLAGNGRTTEDYNATTAQLRPNYEELHS
ncbi:hypothetical protein C8R45DRAFT_1073896 [Mycena sanguinolenta]|nr:hypothetical protein C8R45DRAFT_1073896 [Mycena sanguinolenta]